MKVKDQYITDNMALYNGDSCEVLKGIPDSSIHFSIYSPPFASLYTYSNSSRDLGNCRTQSEFYEHFEFIVSELYRALIPGRIMALHCTNLPTLKERDGFIGIRDFRGDLIRIFEKAGFIYHSDVCIRDSNAENKGSGAAPQAAEKGQHAQQAGHSRLSDSYEKARSKSRACHSHKRKLPCFGMAEICFSNMD